MSTAAAPQNFNSISTDPFDLIGAMNKLSELRAAFEKAADSKELREQVVNQLLQIHNFLVNDSLQIQVTIDQLEERKQALIGNNQDNLPNAASLTGGATASKTDKALDKSTLSYDLNTLEGRLKNNLKFGRDRIGRSLGDDIFAKIANENGDQLEAMLLSGKFPHLKQYASNSKIARELGLSIGDEALAALASLMVNEKGYQTILEARAQQKDKGGSLVFGALQITVRNVINNVAKTINNTIDVAKSAALSTVMNTRLGQAAVNAATKVKVLGTNITATVNTAGTYVRSALYYPGKVLATGVDLIKIGGIAAKSGITAILPATALYIVAGSSAVGLPVAIGAGAVMAITRTVQGVLGDSQLTNISFINRFKQNYGWGQYMNNNGTWNVQGIRNAVIANGAAVNGFFGQTGEVGSLGKLQLLGVRTPTDQAKMEAAFDNIRKVNKLNTEGNVFGNFAKGVRAFNSVTTFGSIGALIATFFSINPIIGGIAAGTAAGGFSLLRDSVWGKALTAKSGLLAKLGQLPMMDVIGQIQSNLWVANQLNIIATKYHGDVGRYFDENLNPFKASQRGGLEFIMSLGNIGQSINFVLPFSSGAAMMQLSKFANLLTGIQGLKNFLPIGVATTLGTVSSLALLTAFSSQLGIVVGPIAVIAATVGGMIGALALGALVLAGGPLTWLGLGAFFAGGLLGGSLFGGIGGYFDKLMNKSVGSLMILFTGIAAFLNFLSLMQQKLNMDNIIVFVLSLISFIQAFDKLGGFGNNNTCIDAECRNPTGKTGSVTAPNVDVFGYYQVYVVSEIPLSALQRQGLIAYLDVASDNLHKKFPGKQIFINVKDSSSFESDSFVMLAVNPSLLIEDSAATTIAAQVNSELGNLSQVAGVQVLLN